jgi:glutaredoxin
MRIIAVLFAALAGVLASFGWIHYRQQALAPVIESGDYSALLAEHDASLLLFAAEDCPFSEQARAHLKSSGARFVEITLDAALAARLGFVDEQGRGMAPALLDHQRRLLGYNAERYSAFLDR